MQDKAKIYAEKMKQQLASEDYSGIVGTLAEAITEDVKNGELMYNGAYAYFMIGDYLRAAEWCQNALEFGDKDVSVATAARLLLARICILEDRTEDGMKLLDLLLGTLKNALTEEQKDDIEDILDYYKENEKELVLKYSHIAAFLGLEEDAEIAPAGQVADEMTPQLETASQSAPETAESVPAEQTAAPAEAAAQPSEQRTDPAEVSAQAKSVLGQEIGLTKKVQLLNKFAGGYFAAGDLAAAKICLDAALPLDTENAMTLRNLAVLAHAAGDRERALAFATAMPETDFLLLARLRS